MVVVVVVVRRVVVVVLAVVDDVVDDVGHHVNSVGFVELSGFQAPAHVVDSCPKPGPGTPSGPTVDVTKNLQKSFYNQIK